MKSVYRKASQTTRGKGSNPFPEWSLLDLQMQQEAREAVLAIPQFPDLEKRLVSVFGPTAEALMVHQLIYWYRRPKMQNRWTLYKTRDEWREERGLNRKQVDRGRARLKPFGVVEERIGPYRRVHYRIDWVHLAEVLGAWDELPEDDFDPLYSPEF